MTRLTTLRGNFRMLWAALAIILGLALLAWSADHFVEGAAAVARHLGAPTLLIGIVIIGFGTSAPEMVISAIAAMQGNPGLALGNAYGSNITNLALILGLTALISPIPVRSGILRKELPLLALVTAFAAWQLFDGGVSRNDAFVLIGLFFTVMSWSIIQSQRTPTDAITEDFNQELNAHAMSPRSALTWLLVGLVMMVLSSRLLVWGAVSIAHALGVSDLIIGLTIVAVGTSLPELASAISAVRKGEHDLALGNVIGSNLFNTLAVVGIAGAIHPMAVDPAVLTRDMPVMVGLTLSLFVFGYGFRGPGRINRVEGALLLSCYLAYTGYLVTTQFVQ